MLICWHARYAIVSLYYHYYIIAPCSVSGCSRTRLVFVGKCWNSHEWSDIKLIVELAQHPAYLDVISLLRWPERISEWGCGSRNPAVTRHCVCFDWLGPYITQRVCEKLGELLIKMGCFLFPYYSLTPSLGLFPHPSASIYFSLSAMCQLYRSDESDYPTAPDLVAWCRSCIYFRIKPLARKRSWSGARSARNEIRERLGLFVPRG